ncbi:hypothetical protein EXN66_Car011340 [Channa argus]|uniref:Uncharacterized protein n=1 Tax=Channa argus TaxID=215402 RepID=A0A6G1PZU1_CHAAH|nr:hypothetical protein EXN66_Car011340 [Channa argus]
MLNRINTVITATNSVSFSESSFYITLFIFCCLSSLLLSHPTLFTLSSFH